MYTMAGPSRISCNVNDKCSEPIPGMAPVCRRLVIHLPVTDLWVWGPRMPKSSAAHPQSAARSARICLPGLRFSPAASPARPVAGGHGGRLRSGVESTSPVSRPRENPIIFIHFCFVSGFLLLPPFFFFSFWFYLNDTLQVRPFVCSCLLSVVLV